MKALFLTKVLAGVVSCGLAVNASSQQYTFTTIAGSPGVIGSEDGTNSQARFNFPSGIAVDDEGVVYVTDLLNSTVRQIEHDGANWVVSTLAGTAGMRGWADGTNGGAVFDRPVGIAVDQDRTVFVADKYNNVIRKLTLLETNWVVTTIAGQAGVRAHDDGTNSAAHFWGPAGLAVGRSNEVYVADSSNFIIRRLVPEGTNWVVSTIAGTALEFDHVDGINQNARFNFPWGVTVNSAGILYVADSGNSAIRRLEQVGRDWVTTTLAGVPETVGTNDGPAALAMFNDPFAITVWQDEQVLATDWSNHTVRKIAPVAKDWFVTTAGGAALMPGTADGLGTDARFRKPYGVAVSKTGVLFVADYSNHTIRMGVCIPSLEIASRGGQVILSWPLWADKYVLEKSGALSPSSAWVPWTNGVAVSGNVFVLTNDVAGPAFFRLRL